MKTILITALGLSLLITTGCKENSGITNNPPDETPSPTITSISPDSGKFGTAVTIMGSNFGSTAEANTVTFNGLEAVVSVSGKTELLVEVPKGAGSGPVAVTVDGRTTNGPNFTYLPDNARFVNGDTGTDTENDCNNVQIPCATIGYAIEQAESGDQLLIAAGIYTESLEIDKSIILKGSGESSTIIQAHPEPRMAERRVILIHKSHEISISSLTIRHGGVSSFLGSGGGINNIGSSLILNNVSINHNTAYLGGGIYNSGTLELNKVSFKNNEVPISGGGLYNDHSSAMLTDITFSGNRAEGTSLFVSNGGGMYNIESSPILTNVIFIGNRAEGKNDEDGGGGMYSVGSSSLPVLTDVTFDRNIASSGGGGLRIKSGNARLKNVQFLSNNALNSGGGIFVEESSPVLTNVVFYSNISGFGGGMCNRTQSTPTLINTTFNGNIATFDGGAIENVAGSAPTLFNSIVWGNTAGIEGNEIDNSSDSSIRLFYSLFRAGSDHIAVGGGFEANNSLITDPLFADVGIGNLRLQAESPAINTGNPDTNFDFFATDGNGSLIDLDGTPRVIGGRIDMGAYEYQNK